MKKVIIDFSKCKSYIDIHYLIKDKLGFPKWYGANLDALWDCLTGGFIEYCEVQLKGMDKLPKALQSEIIKIIDVFKEADKSDIRDIKLIL